VLSTLLFCAAALATQTPAAPTPAPTAGGTATATATEAPPPSSWDKAQVAAGKTPEVEETATDSQSWSLTGQLVRTLVSLAIVVGLVYLFGKTVLPRLAGLKLGASGKIIKVIERVQVDGRHALLLVEVQNGPTLLLGTGDKGVALITELRRDGNTPSGTSTFTTAMDRARQASSSTSAEGNPT
jgi:flagellar biogenesis protein FliO